MATIKYDFYFINIHVFFQGTGAQNNMGLDMLMNMFGGLSGLGAGGGGLNVPNTPNCIIPLLLSCT